MAALPLATMFGAAFACAKVALLGRIPLVPILTALCVAVRHARRARFAPTLAVVALLWYGATALPWFRLYLSAVILHGGT